MKTSRLLPILLLFCTLASTTSCRHNRLPDGVVDTATMTAFLTEGTILESYYNTIIVNNKDSLGYQLQAAYDSLYRKYNITPEQYKSSVEYYTEHPALFEDIYLRVRNAVKKEQDKYLQTQ